MDQPTALIYPHSPVFPGGYGKTEGKKEKQLTAAVATLNASSVGVAVVVVVASNNGRRRVAMSFAATRETSHLRACLREDQYVAGQRVRKAGEERAICKATVAQFG